MSSNFWFAPVFSSHSNGSLLERFTCSDPDLRRLLAVAATMSSVVVDDLNDLAAYLGTYGEAFAAGLNSTQESVRSSVRGRF